MHDRQTDLNSFLDEAASYPESHVQLPVNWLEDSEPDLLSLLQENGFLLPDDRPQFIDYYGETCAINYLDNPDGTFTMFFCEDEGTFHTIRGEKRHGWKVTLDPLPELVHESLQCRGNIEEAVSNFLWKIGVATQQSREIWLCRNSATTPALAEHLKDIPKSAILFLFGNCGGELPRHTFKLFNYLTTVNGSLAFDAEAVLAALQENLASREVRRGTKPAYGKQKNSRKSIEAWLWMWLDARLKAAKIIAWGGDEEDVASEWAQYEVLSQKQICDALSINPTVYTRTKETWEKDTAGYGGFFLLINGEFVQRRPLKNTAANSTAVQRLNGFYHAHRKTIEELRRHPPNMF